MADDNGEQPEVMVASEAFEYAFSRAVDILVAERNFCASFFHLDDDPEGGGGGGGGGGGVGGVGGGGDHPDLTALMNAMVDPITPHFQRLVDAGFKRSPFYMLNMLATVEAYGRLADAHLFLRDFITGLQITLQQHFNRYIDDQVGAFVPPLLFR